MERSGGSTLAAYAFPTLGALQVNEITRRHVVDALSPIWTSKPETARRGVVRAARRVAGRLPLPRCTCFGCATRRPHRGPDVAARRRNLTTLRG